LLGGNLAKVATENFETYATYRTNTIKMPKCEAFALDMTKQDDVNQLVEKISPDAIIHTAAIANVDYCESHPDEAKASNVDGTRYMAEAAAKLGAKFVYISTDSVFDGERGMYTEADEVNPLSEYSKSKLEGEKVLDDIDVSSAVIRTTIYGWNMQDKTSLGEWAINELKAGNEVKMFEDVFFTPLMVNNLSDALLEVAGSGVEGVLNLGSPDRCSKFEFGQKIAEVFGFDKSLVSPISVKEFGSFKAPRPRDPSLDVSKAKRELSTELLSVGGGVKLMRDLEKNGYVDELKSYLVR